VLADQVEESDQNDKKRVIRILPQFADASDHDHVKIFELVQKLDGL